MNLSIKLYTTSSCSDCRRAKQFLRVRQIPFEEIDIDSDPEAQEFVKRANGGASKVPTFEVGGRIFHCSPFDTEKLVQEFGVE
jgi:glutaredoxin